MTEPTLKALRILEEHGPMTIYGFWLAHKRGEGTWAVPKLQQLIAAGFAERRGLVYLLTDKGRKALEDANG